jgi:hypothetical protein
MLLLVSRAIPTTSAPVPAVPKRTGGQAATSVPVGSSLTKNPSRVPAAMMAFPPKLSAPEK